jgi:hypothetical protein
MERKELARILNELLTPVGFKKKGDYWVKNGDLITKLINLQKSQFSNSFYLNYGYILKSIPLGNLMMHVYKRFNSDDSHENIRIQELLDLENDISDADRGTGIKQLMLNKVIQDINTVNTEEDLLNELKKRPHLNNIPLVVRKHFNLT